MKKLLSFIIILGVYLVSFAGKTETISPNELIRQSFRNDFPLAKNISWEKVVNNIYVVQFVNNYRTQLAYYTDEGDFIGQGWIVNIGDLPASLQKSVLKKSKQEDLQEVYLFLPPDALPVYYVTFLSKGKKKVWEIQANGESSVVLKKETRLANK